MIEAKIICDSLAPCGKRLTTYVLTYPWSIHPQLLTHRVFSRNSQSARAMPISKMVERCLQNPAIPERWGVNGKGMQPKGDVEEKTALLASSTVRLMMRDVIDSVSYLESLGVHKEQSNRYLLPYSHITTVLSATDYGNFFYLRVHGDTQEEHASLAHEMLGVYLASEPKPLKAGEWHMPFMDRDVYEGMDIADKLKVATARCARASYVNFYGKLDKENDFHRHDELKKDGHMSPFEHCAMALDEPLRVGNFVGFHQYRKMIPYENRTTTRDELQAIYDKWKEQAK